MDFLIFIKCFLRSEITLTDEYNNHMNRLKTEGDAHQNSKNGNGYHSDTDPHKKSVCLYRISRWIGSNRFCLFRHGDLQTSCIMFAVDLFARTRKPGRNLAFWTTRFVPARRTRSLRLMRIGWTVAGRAYDHCRSNDHGSTDIACSFDIVCRYPS